MRPYATDACGLQLLRLEAWAANTCGLKLLTHAVLSYECMRPEATDARGLPLLMHEALSYYHVRHMKPKGDAFRHEALRLGLNLLMYEALSY
jgi:hypothetical protein